MSMTRYYYTDPLEAAYMAKHFGMRFDAPVQPVFRWDGQPAIQFVSDKFYIHSDNLHLLQPREGDFVAFDEIKPSHVQRCWGILCNIKPETHEYRWVYDDGKAVYASSTPPRRVIQRDGKPFFWPE